MKYNICLEFLAYIVNEDIYSFFRFPLFSFLRRQPSTTGYDHHQSSCSKNTPSM